LSPAGYERQLQEGVTKPFLYSHGGGLKCRVVVNKGLATRGGKTLTMWPKWLVAMLVVLPERWSARREAVRST